MSDLVSIIVPVFNAEKFVEKTIDSLIEQTYTNLEIIVVDDGSTDSSPTLCEKYISDTRVKVFHRKNLGLSASRQYGIDICNGEYFATIDSDDYVSKDFIEKLYNKIKRDCSDICVCGRYDFYDGDALLYKKDLKLNYEALSVTKQILKSDYRKIGSELILSDSWNKLYRTEFVKKSGVRFELERRFNGNDLAFNYKLVLHCPRYSIVNQPLLYHRILQGSLVHRKNKPLQEGFETITEQIIREAGKCRLEINDQIGLLYYNLLYLVFLDIVEYSESKNDRKKKLQIYSKRNMDFIEKYPFMQVSLSDAVNILQKNVFRLTKQNDVRGIIRLSSLFIATRKIKRFIVRKRRWD